MRRLSAVVVFGLLSGATANIGQAQSPSTSAIRGRVVAADTGDPIRNARVSAGDGPDARVALTDGEGRFMMTADAGTARQLSAAKTGYVRKSVAANSDVEIRLTRGAVITGRVLDDLGAPLPLVSVIAERIDRTGGTPAFAAAETVETNDLGEFRLFSLPPGEFVVGILGVRVFQGTGGPAAVPPPLQPPHNFYPHAEKPEQADPIAVAAGEEKPGINLVIALPPPGLRASGQPPRRPLGSGRIEGRVSHADGLPVRGGRVRLSTDDDQFAPMLTTTDDDGRYEFPGLQAGSYLVTAAMVGMNDTAFGSTTDLPRGELVALKAGGALNHIDITLPRTAAIAGRILDEYGEPMENANVRVERIVTAGDRRRLAGVPAIAPQQTNDLGAYRISGLPPGRYLVEAIVGEPVPGRTVADWPGYARTYYPGTPNPDEAQVVEIGTGQQALTIDFALARGHLVRISGTARTSDGTPLHGTVAIARSARSGAIALAPTSVRTSDDGRFELARVIPGEYVLQAATSRGSVSSEGEFAATFITIEGQDVKDVALNLSPGSSIAGRLILEGGDRPEDPDFRISAVPIDPDLTSIADDTPARADIHEDLTFEMGGISGPRRLALTHAPDGWTLSAIRINGVDATDAVLPFGTPDQSLRDVEVVLTTRVGSVAITAHDADGQSLSGFRVLAFSTDRTRWYKGSRFVALGVPGRDGAVTLNGLPAGDYFVVAIDRRASIEVQADLIQMMEPLVARATRVTLTDGERRSISIVALR